MTEYRTKNKLNYVNIGLRILITLVFIAAGIILLRISMHQSAVEHDCLEAGYSGHRISGMDGYCIRIVNNSEEVVPVEQVRAGLAGQ